MARVEVTLKCVVDTDVSNPSQDDVGDAFFQFLGENDETMITDMLTFSVLEEPKRYKDTPGQAEDDARLTSFFYDKTKFRKYFTTPYQQYAKYIGMPFKVIRRDAKASKEAGEDIFLIKFADGTKISAWGLEVCKLNRRKCS